jgi:hypothetical protein
VTAILVNVTKMESADVAKTAERKFRENPSYYSQVQSVPTDGQTDGQTNITKLMVRISQLF